MKLPKPSAPYDQLEINGESITLDTPGKILILSTDDSSTLPDFNQWSVGRTLTAGTYNFTDDPDVNTGLHNLIYPFIVVYDASKTEADFFSFTERPNNLQCFVGANGMITQLILYPGNGRIYYGRINYPDLTLDSNSNGIPDFLEAAMPGSLTKFLQTYDFPTVLIKSSDDLIITFSDDKTWEAAR